MIVHDLNVIGIAAPPAEADSPLVVDTNAPLSRSFSVKFFEAIGRRNSQILKTGGAIQHTQFTQRHLLDITRQAPRALAIEYPFRLLALEAPDHQGTL